jgi:uncharacterized protein (DUF952 family)
MMYIYKILRAQEWADFEAMGKTHGASVDISDGFIHFSTATQLGETLRRHFGGESKLMCVCVKAGGLGSALVWEVSRGNALFPHLYGPLSMDQVAWVRPFADGPDGAVVPEGVA